VDERQEGTPRLAELLERAWTGHGLKGIATAVVQLPSEANRWTAVVQATVETERGAFGGLGEASPERAGPGGEARLVESAEARAVARALGWATNTVLPGAPLPVSGEGAAAAAPAPPERRPAGDEPAAVPAFLRTDDGPTAAPSEQPPAAPVRTSETREPAAASAYDRPGGGRAVERGSRAFVTAQSLWKACAARGIEAPEPEPDWAEPRLQEYIATWSAELKQAAGPARSRRSSA
jgi:hypothetical protein